MKIALFYGGSYSEREVSIMSASAIEAGLKRLGHEIILIDVDSNLIIKLKELLRTEDFKSIDLAFIAMHGKHGEDGCLQGLLDCLNIPYTHSGVRASAICMHKPTAKIIFDALGINTAYHKILNKDEILANKVLYNKKYVVKPTAEGSSVNVFIFDKAHSFSHENYPFIGEVMVEEYIPGRELQVAVIQGKAVGVVEIICNKEQAFYDYEAKYTEGKAEHIIPANITEKIYNKLLEQAERVYNFLGCRGVARADFRFDEENNNLVMLEFNTHPGFTKLSLVPEIAQKCCNIDFDQLVEIIINDTIYHQNNC